MKDLLTYLFTKKKSKNNNVRAMHIVNYISIAIFIVGLVVILSKFL